jgi:hypothetical protein
MPRGYGEIALAIQSAKGSAAASSAFRFNVVSGMPEAIVEPVAVPDVRTTRIAGGAYVPTPQGGGESTALCRPRMVGALLYGVLGAKAVSGSSDPWTHTITLGSLLPWLTVWRSIGGILNERFVDARITGLTISSRAQQIVTVSFTIASGSPRFRTSQETTATLEETQHFEHDHATAALLVEGTAFRSIDEWTLQITPGIVMESTLAGWVPRMSGVSKITLTAAYRPADASLLLRAAYGSASPSNDAAATTTPLVLAGSPVGVQFTLTAATGPERSLRIAIPQVVLAPPKLQPAPGSLRTLLTMEAYAPAAGSPITATLKNNLSAY